MSIRSCCTGSISPSVFQTFMNKVFREFLHRFVIVYIDDILIYSRNLAEHRQHVQQVLHKLCDHSLYLKLEKCEFHRPSVQFLGYIITAEGMQMDQGKVSTIMEWPQPVTVKELQHFLGFAHFYRRFIKDYSSITALLTSLLRGKPKELCWNPSAQEAFLHLKKIFSTAPLLHHPDPELPFTLIDLRALATLAANGPSRSYNLGTGGPVCAEIPSGKLVPLPIPQRPWSHIGVDFVTDLPAAESNTCILVMVDRFSKMCKRTYCQEDQHSWSRFLPWAEYAQNSLRQDTTRLTPFQCVLWYQPPLFSWPEEPSNVPAVDHWFQESERVWDSAHHHLQWAVRQHKRFADARRRPAPKYQPGDLVWLSTRDLRLRQPCRKLSPRFIGPFKILRRINDVTFQLQLPPRHSPHIPCIFTETLSSVCHKTLGAEAEPPPPEILELLSIYTVHEILDLWRRGGHLEYLVDWEGYGPEEQSWVPREDILDPTLLSDFHRDHPDCPAPRGHGCPQHRVRALGAAPGGGGSVRHSPQPPPSDTPPVTPPTCSASQEY
ncbi:Retrovirus-related Pol polyprotein [Labeo rohita]|uniref:ribonuclease H n=1 Tax=Labeo rohita TaxID=84645 RepID=A0ABQ8L738_LABRO|nr:Retrovirus-related Pol polyprotein [Labeo rohita]